MKRYTKLLAGASWAAEYGDPDEPSDWAFLKRHSPYHPPLAMGSRLAVTHIDVVKGTPTPGMTTQHAIYLDSISTAGTTRSRARRRTRRRRTRRC